MAARLPASDREANTTHRALKVIYYLAVGHNDRLHPRAIPCETTLDTRDLFCAHPREMDHANTWNKSIYGGDIV